MKFIERIQNFVAKMLQNKKVDRINFWFDKLHL